MSMSTLYRSVVLGAAAAALAAAGLVVVPSPAAAALPLGSTGSQDVLVMRAYWSAGVPDTPSDSDADNLLNDVRDWFTQNAGGHLTLTADRTDWLPIGGPHGGCQTDRTSLLQQAKDAAQSRGFSVDSYEDFVLYFPTCTESTDPQTWASQGDQGVWLNGVFDLHSIVNGLGHNMGLPTADARECARGDQQEPCDLIAGGDFGAMGDFFASHFGAAEKNRLGWFDSTQVSDLTAGGSASLGALSMPGAHVAFITSGGRTYWLESRYSSGYDGVLPESATNAVLVHEVNSDGSTALLNTRPASESPDDWRIQQGQMWVTAEGYTISVTGVTPGVATVNVNRPPRLTVSRSGTGSGTVTSSPAGITCGAGCSVPFRPGTSVTLTAAPTGGSTFAGWSGGGCTGMSATCSLTVNSDTTVTAAFTSSAALRSEESAVGLDGWAIVSNAAANGGSWRVSTVTGNSASFPFTGTAVTLLTHRGPQLGVAGVTIDGVNKGTVDLYAATDQAFSKAFSGLAAVKHTIVVTVNGTRNAFSTGTGIVVDAFGVAATTTQDSAKTVTYDTWKSASATAASGGAYRSTTKANATATLTFSGTSIDWITATGPNRGKAEVAIDGAGVGTVDLYATSAHWQATRSYSGLGAGRHTIRVRVLGTKNAASTSTAVPIDAFVVR